MCLNNLCTSSDNKFGPFTVFKGMSAENIFFVCSQLVKFICADLVDAFLNKFKPFTERKPNIARHGFSCNDFMNVDFL